MPPARAAGARGLFVSRARESICVVSETADVFYQQSNLYSGERERGFRHDDPPVAIEWPLPTDELIPSKRDATRPTLPEIAAELPSEYRQL